MNIESVLQKDKTNNDIHNIDTNSSTNSSRLNLGTVDADTGALILIDIMYQKGKINEVTYNKIKDKYKKEINE